MSADALLAALRGVRFWEREMDVGFVQAAEDGGLLLRSEGRGYDVKFGTLVEPDGLLLPWATAGGLIAGGLPEVLHAAALPLFEDTRQRFSSATGCDAAHALYRFALCRDRSHARRCDYRVLCPECLAPVEAAYAQGVELSLARDAARMLRSLAQDERRTR